jgi:hypothetical protein
MDLSLLQLKRKRRTCGKEEGRGGLAFSFVIHVHRRIPLNQKVNTSYEIPADESGQGGIFEHRTSRAAGAQHSTGNW